jgi:two-component system alkaline phosphatase synthesis response regulator PhoP
MSKKIFLVDDDPDLVMAYRAVLEKEGYAVEVAYDGQECLERVRDVAPDLIVLDVMMPRRNGYEVCKELKADGDLAGIPVVLLTAVASHVGTTTYTHRMGMEVEAEDYVPKPVEPSVLIASVKKLLK